MAPPDTNVLTRPSSLKTESTTESFYNPDEMTGSGGSGGGGGGSGGSGGSWGSGSGGSGSGGTGSGGTWGSGGSSSAGSSVGSSWGSSWGGSDGAAQDPQHPSTGNTSNPYGSDPKHFEYEISTGKLYLVDDKTGAKSLVGTGYSGNGSAINNPNDQNVSGHGPVPEGDYTLGGLHDSAKTGKDVMNLTPSPDNDMYGRSAFEMHGDNKAQNFTASDGCIIMTKAVRDFVGSSGVTDLRVVQ